MSDVFTKAKRSEVMSRIRSRGNKDTELALARLLRKHRITGWRRHLEIRGRARHSVRAAARQSKIGAHGVTRPTVSPAFRVKPDFVFPKSRLAIFVDGCFWHGCPRHATQPKNNRLFWRKKLAGNKTRDRRVNRALRSANWQLIRIWECALRRATKHRATKQRVTRQKANQKSRATERLVRRIQEALR